MDKQENQVESGIVESRFSKFCYAISTFGSLGEWWFGGVVASLFALPLIFLLRSLYWLSITIFWWMLAVGIMFLFVTVFITLRRYPEKAYQSIVWDKIIGVIIALAGVSLRWRVVIFGLVLFHLLNIFRPIWSYRKFVRTIERLPGILGVFGGEIVSGLVVNLFLHLIAWVMG